MSGNERQLLRWLPDAARRHRWPILVVVALLSVAAAAALPGLRLQSGIYELFPRSPGPIADLADFGRLFSASREVVVLVSGEDPSAVARGSRLTAFELSRSPRFRDVRAGVESLALLGALGRSLLLLGDDRAWERIRHRLEGDLAPHVARLRRLVLSPIAPGREAVARDPLGLSELVLESLESGIDHGTGLYASPDGRAALVFAAPTGEDPGAVHVELARIKRIVLQRTGGKVSLRFTGAPVYSHHFARTMRRDLTLSSSAALAGVVLVLLVFFRSVRLLPIAGAVGALAVGWTLAVAAVTGVRLNMLSLAFAALCIGMGMDALIHISARTRGVSGSPGERVPAAMRRLMPALLAASLTTIAAFLSFSLSAFEGLSMTGLLAACGLTFTVVLTLLLAPTFLAPAPAADRAGLLDRLLQRLSRLHVGRWRVAVVLVSTAVGGGALVAAVGLRFSTDLTRLAPRQLPPARADRAIARHFERHTHRLIVLARGPRRDRVLQVNDALARRLARLRDGGSVASFRSLSALVPALATQRARRDRLRSIGPSRIAARLKKALDEAGLRAELFTPFIHALEDPAPITPQGLPESLRPLVRRQLGRSGPDWVVATLVYPAAGVAPESLARTLGELSGVGVQVGVTGATLAGRQMARLLRADLLLVSLVSLGVVLVLVSVLLRRLWPVVATLLSLLWTGLTFAGLVRLLGYEVDLYNLMVIPVLVGYGVDDHIYVVRGAVEGEAGGGVQSTGRAVVITTLTSMAAFGSLQLCDLPGLRVLGMTAVVGLGLGLVGSLVVMPALLSFRGERG